MTPNRLPTLIRRYHAAVMAFETMRARTEIAPELIRLLIAQGATSADSAVVVDGYAYWTSGRRVEWDAVAADAGRGGLA